VTGMRRVLRLAAVAALAAAGLAIGPVGAVGPAQASPTHVGVVIAGDKTACVPWHSGMTGDDVLHAVAKVTYRYDGLIVQIDGKPVSGTADNTHYWAYWHNTKGYWVYSGEGAGTYLAPAGSVEGWAYSNGTLTKPPLVSYTSICHDTTSPVPTTKPASTRPASTSSASAPAQIGHASSSSDAPPPFSSHAGVSATPRTKPPSRHGSATATQATTAGQSSTVDSATPSPSPSPSAPPKKHHSASAAPAAGTAAGLVAAAAIGGVAFWRIRRQDGN
jgi:hypothetical protein